MRTKKAINIAVGRNIQNARKNSGLTQEQLSERLEIMPNHMSAIERGVSGATLSQLQKLCEILNVSADQLLFGTEQADDETTAMVKRLLRVPPEYRKQLYQIIAASLEILKIETKE